MSTATLERTCMRCGTSELDHPARYEENICLLLADAMTVSWTQARDRYQAGLWPAPMWEAYQRGHAYSADRYWGTPTPAVTQWVQRLEWARREPIAGDLYQHPVPMF
ncbi:hypothetical protein [Pseudactinotalea terrae]|uniref:hypothetical protein n=1 Tax=Pseudactinotalea terrae TaxID=1743262 RepID=UPI0012E16EAC|nr:hypothetical protein [Pseudactinotalea terrae]